LANGLQEIDNVGGAGILNNGTLTVTISAFSGNSAGHFSGGAIRNYDGGTLTVTNSTFSGNSAAQGAGMRATAER
jgi:hypothetical protein